MYSFHLSVPYPKIMGMNLLFENRQIEVEERDLLSLGFSKEENSYVLSRAIMDGQFILMVRVDKEITAEVVDAVLHEPYTLFRLNNLHSGFAYSVKMAVQEILDQMFSRFIPEEENFPSRQFALLEEEMISRFDEPSDAPFKTEKNLHIRAFRLKKNRKWYGLAIFVFKEKLGLEGKEEIPCLLLRGKKGEAPLLVDQATIFPSYHMNKKNWVTVPLDAKMKDDELLRRLLDSRKYVDQGL